MTIGAVLNAPSSQPQVRTSESGFSGVLSEVRAATAHETRTDFAYTQQRSQTSTDAETPSVESDFGAVFSEFVPSVEKLSVEEYDDAVAELLSAENLDVTVKSESISAEFKNTVISLVSSVAEENGEESGRIIDALLKVLKKMQDDTEDGLAANLLMEILASVSGVSSEPVIKLDASVTEICVTTENTEIAVILSGEAEAIGTSAQVAAQTAESPENKTVSTGKQTAESHAFKEEMANAPVETENAAEQPSEPLSSSSQEKLLTDLLSLAKKELGLTKATLTTEAPAVQTEQAESTFIPVINHKSGMNELNSILNGTEEKFGVAVENAKEQEIKPVNIANDAAAVFTNSAPAQQIEAPIEKPVQVEAPLPEQQIADEILSKPETLSGGKTEFTMVLNPEHLGKITVRLVSTEGRVDVQISAENDTTKQLLESRAENIGAALKNNGVELERYQVVSEQENSELMQQNYDGSSKNPYGRNDENESQNDDSTEDFLEILQQL